MEIGLIFLQVRMAGVTAIVVFLAGHSSQSHGERVTLEPFLASIRELAFCDWVILKPWSSQTLVSERNGKIIVKRWFGRPEIEVDGYVQSGEYMQSLWSNALWRASTTPGVKSVLMLGLGCGSAIAVLENRFPGCNITAIEWDPIMIHLAHQLNWFKPNPQITVLCGDAFEILPTLTQRFDLVLSDLFRGDALEPRLTSQKMVSSIAHVLRPHGQLIVNAFKDGMIFSALAKHLDYVQNWQFRNNQLALFQLLVPKLHFATQ